MGWGDDDDGDNDDDTQRLHKYIKSHYMPIFFATLIAPLKGAMAR